MSEANIPQNPNCSQRQFGLILNYDQYGRIFSRPLRFGRLHGVYQVGVLSELTVGDTGVLVALDLPENVQNHLMHMGFVPDAEVTALRRAPAGDPTVYGIDGMEIALRHETASAIQIRPLEVRSAAIQTNVIQPNGIRSAEVRPFDAAAQPGHKSSVASKRGSVAPKFVEAAR
jgi:ferrous iron transport protein A